MFNYNVFFTVYFPSPGLLEIATKKRLKSLFIPLFNDWGEANKGLYRAHVN